MAHYVTDWTGSGAQRRPQGTCSPFTPTEVTRQWVPAGTHVTVKRIDGYATTQWKPHRMRIDLEIVEIVRSNRNFMIFAHEDWVICVDPKHIRQTRTGP